MATKEQLQIDALKEEIAALREELASVPPHIRTRAKAKGYRPLSSDKDTLEYLRTQLDSYGELSFVAEHCRTRHLTAVPEDFNDRGLRLARARLGRGDAVPFGEWLPRDAWAEVLGLTSNGLEMMQ